MSTLAEDEWTEGAPLMGSAGLPPGWAVLGTVWKTFQESIQFKSEVH